jgi:hypothetical protein
MQEFDRDDYVVFNGYDVSECKKTYTVMINNMCYKTLESYDAALEYAKQTAKGKFFDIISSHLQKS